MTRIDDNLSLDTRRHFLQALRRILRPIIRLMIRSGIRYDEFVDVARGAYVESAIRDVDKDAPRPTRNQVAWITRIRRELVDHYIESNEPLASEDPISESIATEVLHRWYTDPRYRGPTGEPLELEFEAPEGISFKELVAQSDAQADAGLIREQLLRAKSVTRSGENRIRAVSRLLIWPEDVISQSQYWGTALARVIETHEYNFNSRNAEDKRLERSVFADHGLSEELLPAFHSAAQERADKYLYDLDDWLAQHADAGRSPTGPRVQIGVHVFFYMEALVEPTSKPVLAQPGRKQT
jgi:hypothetical protein